MALNRIQDAKSEKFDNYSGPSLIGRGVTYIDDEGVEIISTIVKVQNCRVFHHMSLEINIHLENGSVLNHVLYFDYGGNPIRLIYKGQNNILSKH